MEEKLIFADGMELTPAHLMQVRADELILYIQTPGLTFRETYELLEDGTLAQRIQAQEIDGTVEIYEGFAELVGLRKEDDGQITAILKKAVEANAEG